MTRSTTARWALLLVAAVALRAGWVAWSAMGGDGGLAYPDEELHWRLATNLLERGELVTNDGRYAARMPLYPLLLSGCAAFGDAGIFVARAVQALFGGLTCVVVARLASRIWGAAAAGPAFVLAAFDPFAVFFANLLLTETVFTLLFVSFVAATWRMIEQPRDWIGAFAVAGLGAALVLTRPSAVLLLPLMWVATISLARVRGPALQRIAMAPLVLVIALLPWGLRNVSVIGSFAWLSTNGGVTLYDAQGPQADGSSDQRFLAQKPDLAPMGEAARDAHLRDLALRQMRQNPGRVAQLGVTKLQRTWNPFPNVEEYRGGLAAWAGGLYTVVVYGLAAAALLRSAWHGRGRAVAVLLLPCVYFALLHAIYIGSIRYRLPVMPLLMVLGAAVIGRARRGESGAGGPVRAGGR